MAIDFLTARFDVQLDGIGYRTVPGRDFTGVPSVLVSPEVLTGSLTFDLQNAAADTELLATNSIGAGFVANINAQGNLKWGSGTAFSGTLDHAITAPRTWSYPDFNGNVLVDSGGAVTVVSSVLNFTVNDGGVSDFIARNTGLGLWCNIRATGDLAFNSQTAFLGTFIHSNGANRVWMMQDVAGTVPIIDSSDDITYATTALGVNVNDGGVTSFNIANGGAGLWCDLSVSGDIGFASRTSFRGTFEHAIGANRTWTMPNVSGGVMVESGGGYDIINPSFGIGVSDVGVSSFNVSNPGAGLWADISATGDYHWYSRTAFTGSLVHANSANRVYTFLNASGTVASGTPQAAIAAPTAPGAAYVQAEAQSMEAAINFIRAALIAYGITAP